MGAIEELHRWKLSLLRTYVERHGWEDFEKYTVVAPGVKLGFWVARVRHEHKRRRLAPWLVDELEKIPGWLWRGRLRLQRGTRVKMARLRRAMAERGWERLPNPLPHFVMDGVDLGEWLISLRGRHTSGELPPVLVNTLESIPGWEWEGLDAAQRQAVEQLGWFLRKRPRGAGFQLTFRRFMELGGWIRTRRKQHVDGTVDPWLEQSLGSLPGWTWARREGPRYAR